MVKKINIQELQLGMHVEQLDRPWLDTPFLFQGFTIQSADDLDELRRWCRHVYISAEPDPTSRSDPTAEPTSTSYRQFAADLDEAKEIHDKAHALVEHMHDDILTRRRIDVASAKQLVADMTRSVIRQEAALLWFTHLKNRDSYTAQHSLNVCVLALAFGHHLGLTAETLTTLGLGALLHDIGKLRVPLDILNKPDRLTSREFDEMKRHPEHGLTILFESRGIPIKAIDVAHSHHERLSGRGYPRGLRADTISHYSRIVAIVDVYDALTSHRVYRMGVSPLEAVRVLYSGREREFDSQMIEQFVQFLGIYPSGSLVELFSGEVGLVIPDDKRQREKPVILLLLDSDKRPYFPLRILDLKLFSERNALTEIKQMLPPGSFDIDPAAYARELLAARSSTVG